MALRPRLRRKDVPAYLAEKHGIDREDIDGVMRRVRDDLAINARGCIWVRYEAKSKDSGLTERACIEHKNRRDFAHDPAREWKEVGWVAGRAWMTRKEMRLRFQKTSGNAYTGASFAKQKDDKNKSDGKLKAGVWEIWSKTENKVVWVTPGVDVVLDESEPHLSLEGFFPCPQPAYGTVEPNSLVPVPDFLFYKDQAEEVNELTNRISALTLALKVRGFYPSGAGELSDAIEAAIKSVDDRKVLVPISNWAVTGNGSPKDTIVWLPLDMVATTLTQLIALRKQLIDDIYQISGLSDVMRGATNPNETLGAHLRVPAANKIIHMGRSVFLAARAFIAKLSMSTDYQVSLPAAPASTPDNTLFDEWDSGLWDVMKWDGSSEKRISTRWGSIGRAGFVAAPQVQVTCGVTPTPDAELVAIDITYEVGAVVV
ncbi:hypothetical protein [Aminobacter sp. LjRoot7]|uniref:hypothetical protein n=1 Tax=Aminobacter sp. LjRoot7 TaxID=3342335 RepID=UPI003ECEDAA8